MFIFPPGAERNGVDKRILHTNRFFPLTNALRSNHNNSKFPPIADRKKKIPTN